MKLITNHSLLNRLTDAAKQIAAAVLITPLLMTQVNADNSILVQSTTSTANSGLYDYLLPVFEKAHNAKVHVVAVGTGQAIRNAGNCDADVLLVHAKAAEQKFVSDGFGVSRKDLMYNDFVIVGPAADPAAIADTSTATEALTKIAANKSIFASRGDNSGTHKKELSLWQQSATDVAAASGSWYRETGSGMGATLNVAVGMGAYTLTDRATWISFNNKQQHTVLLQGDDALFNQYGIILVNSDNCPNVNSELGQTFIDWITGTDGQQLIADFTLHDQQLFHPNAAP
jgi:tungstate transport system substrate-binding protein